MSMSTGEIGRMMPMKCMRGMGFMRGMGKPNASDITNRMISMISNRDKDGDGALSKDELGRLSAKLGLVDADFNDDGLINQEKLIFKISEKLEEKHQSPKMRGLKMHPIHAIKQIAAETGEESTDVISETQSSSDLVKRLLSLLNLSEEETESFLKTMQNYGINVTV